MVKKQKTCSYLCQIWAFLGSQQGPFKVLGHHPQLVASFFISTSALDSSRGIWELKSDYFMMETLKCKRDLRPNWPTWAGSRVPRQTFMGPSYLEAPDPIGWYQKSSSLHPYGVIYGVYVGKRCHCLVKKQKTCSCLCQILAVLGSQANFWGSGLSATTSCSFFHSKFHPGSHIVEFWS